MKKIILTLFALILVLNVFAQADWSQPSKSFDQYWMIGAKYGIAQFHGDVSNKSFFTKLGAESKPSFGISVSRQITPVLSFKAEFLKSNYFSKNILHWHDTVNFTNLSVTGNVTEFGVYGTLNLNKLFSKNKETGNNWNVYVSSGFGFANWRSKLKDDTELIVVDSIGYNDFGKTTRMTAFSVPFTIGANLLLTDGIWLSVEHSIRFVNSDRMDAYIGNYNDKYTSTTIGIVFKTQKLASILFKRNDDKSSSVSSTKVKATKSTDRSFFRRAPKTKPELQEYTGYNELLPPPVPKIDTAKKVSASMGKVKDVWEAAVDSGRYEITGVKKTTTTTKDIDIGIEPQTGIIPFYRVQVQASKTYIPVVAITKKLALSEKVMVELRSDGWYRYYIGQFSTLNDAKKKLLEMRAKGVKDSFIVSFKSNIRKPIKE